MTEFREVLRVITSSPTMEGAGVHLHRVFGNRTQNEFDPFLLMDDFRGEKPEDYIAGFPWHPHRGIETITYLIEGTVEHGDSLGNKGVIGPGDVQWMTAGSGIIHQEMPQPGANGRMGGFQLWANLPAAQKMMAPRYRDIQSSQIPVLSLPGGGQVRVICGEMEGVRGPVQDILIEPIYLDVSLAAGESIQIPTRRGFTTFAYLIDGMAGFGKQKEVRAENRQMVQFGDGDMVLAQTFEQPVRFLFLSGQPIREPIAWYGPIVMNTREELQIAFEEYRNGTFLKT